MCYFSTTLNILLGLIVLALIIFYQKRIKDLERIREEVEAILEIRTRARTRELRELAESLDEQAEQRTKELQEKVDELERFHRLAVGRELKMIELKKEIEKLKEELE